MPFKDINFDLPFPSSFPKEWVSILPNVDFLMFRNLDHFKFVVSKITQKQNDKCNMTYKKALSMLLKGQTDFPETEQQDIRNLVRSNLLKRGLITQEVYEEFQYAVNGTNIGVDVGKYTAGEADCIITPAKQYIDFFYELYISVSYAWYVTEETVRTNIAKLLATVEELERKHIYIKIVIVMPDRNVCNNRDKRNFFGAIPLFSHKETKSVATMSSVINERLLRKFFFAIVENIYKDDLSKTYGTTVDLPKTMNIGNEFNEIDFFQEVMVKVGYEE